MVKTFVHVREGKIEVKVEVDEAGSFTLNPDDAMDLGLKLLRAAYATKAQDT